MSKPKLHNLHGFDRAGEYRLGNSIFVRCRLCEEIFVILFPLSQQLAYEASCMNGVDKRQSLAFAAPNLSTNDKDVMVSGYCTQCLDDMTEVTPFIIDNVDPDHELPDPEFDQGPEEDTEL